MDNKPKIIKVDVLGYPYSRTPQNKPGSKKWKYLYVRLVKCAKKEAICSEAT